MLTGSKGQIFSHWGRSATDRIAPLAPYLAPCTLAIPPTGKQLPQIQPDVVGFEIGLRHNESHSLIPVH